LQVRSLAYSIPHLDLKEGRPRFHARRKPQKKSQTIT
jgi:hypothetical protein